MSEREIPIVSPERTGEGRQPGDPSPQQIVERIIRVDHAGEYGAIRIYAGQQAVLRRRHLPGHKTRAAVEHMAQQEHRHLKEFDRLLVERHVRPTVLQPIWHVAGFALGAATALLGEKAADPKQESGITLGFLAENGFLK